MYDLAYQMAQQLKSRNNPKPIGPCIGVVVSTSPVKISLQDGQFMLEGEQVYVCNQILERNSKFTAKAKHKQSGSISTSCPVSSHSDSSYTSEGDLTLDGTEIHAKEVWQAGDKVLVIPDASEQQFFVVDIIKGVE